MSLTGCAHRDDAVTVHVEKVRLDKRVPIEHVGVDEKVHLERHIRIDKRLPRTLPEKIRDYLIAHHVNGSIEVARKNVVLFEEGIGFSNIAKRIPNQPLTTFPVGSITKTFVATSIMQLQEQHKLSIRDTVAKYIPDFPRGRRIRLGNLLAHTSGIQPPLWKLGDTKPGDLVREIEKRPIKFHAGTKWDYEDANYMVLGYILEKVTGTPLHEYIQKNIFNKSGMIHSGFIAPGKRTAINSVGYLKDGKKIFSTRVSNPYILYGCGDIYATTDDLRLYDQALMDGKLVTRNSLEQILTPRSRSFYGLGLYNNGNAFYSRGVLGGWDTVHFYFKDHTSVVVLLNIRNKKSEIYKIPNDLYKLVIAKS